MVSLGPPLEHGPRAETPSDGAQLALIAGRLCSAEAAVEAVKPGNRVFVGTACATPIRLVQALERRKPVPPDVELFYFLTSGLEPLWSDQPSAYRHRCFFVGSDVRALVHSRQAEYVPVSLTQIPHLTANGRIKAPMLLSCRSRHPTRTATSVSASRSISP